MIIVNISMDPAEYGNVVTYSQAAKIARAINKEVQRQFPQVITVFKLEESGIISNDGKDKKEIVNEVKSWIAYNQSRIAKEALNL